MVALFVFGGDEAGLISRNLYAANRPDLEWIICATGYTAASANGNVTVKTAPGPSLAASMRPL